MSPTPSTKQTKSVAGNETISQVPNKHIRIIWWLLAGMLGVIFIGLVWWLQVLRTAPEPAATPLRPTVETNREPESTNAYATTQTLGALSTSIELSTIQADLESTDLQSLDADINIIEAELERAF